MDLLREFRDPSSPLLDGFLKSSIRLRTKKSNVISFQGISIGRNEIIIKGEESVGVFRSISSLRWETKVENILSDFKQIF